MDPHLQPGNKKKIAVVFCCPGRHEELAGHPAAKATGTNLDTLLSLLAGALGRDDLQRENVTITNAWPRVEYRAKTGRSQPTAREVLSPENLDRLQRELDDIEELVIFCGEKAKAAGQRVRLRLAPRCVYIGHIGLRGLSSVRRDLGGNPIVAAGKVRGGKERKIVGRLNTERRLAVLVESILLQLCGREGGSDGE